jgi:hypothetical protein
MNSWRRILIAEKALLNEAKATKGSWPENAHLKFNQKA